MCPQCGTYYHEWDPVAGGDIHAYFPKLHVCFGCKSKDDLVSAERANAHEKKDDTAMHGVQIRLQRNPEASVPPLPMSSRKMTSRPGG